MNNAIVHSIVLVMLALAAAVPASAQTPRPERPYRGLFGGSSADPNSKQRFDLTVSLYGGYDDNVLQAGQASFAPDPRFQQSGRYGGGQLSLDYARTGSRGSVDFSAGTDYRYYPVVDQLTGFNSWATVGFGLKITSRTTLRATESISYSPYYSFGGFPGLYQRSPGSIVTSTADFSLLKQQTTSYYTTAALERRMSRRVTGTIDYSYRFTDYTQVYQPLKDSSVGGSLSYRMNTRAALRFGYHYRRGTWGQVTVSEGVKRPVESHDLDIGVDYERPLSRTRRTKLTFGTGSSIVRTYDSTLAPGQEAPAAGEATLFYRNHFLVTGNVGLSTEIGRSWKARADYRRGLQYVEAFPDPFFSDSVALSLGGFVNARARLDAAAAYSNGAVGITVSKQPYTTYTGSLRLEVGLKRWSALYAEYLYYRYRFDSSVVLPAGLTRGLDRNGIRGGVRLWVPLLR